MVREWVIDLQVAEDVIITNGGKITTKALGAGHAGDLRLRASGVEMNNGAFISSEASEASTCTGQTGNLDLQVGG
jgi:hypothetical protein